MVIEVGNGKYTFTTNPRHNEVIVHKNGHECLTDKESYEALAELIKEFDEANKALFEIKIIIGNCNTKD